ncbi:hypothetical protein B4N89_46565 [Embleya scabrispora]|uniref:NYN domain-containing protein n=1 Tax=Embleya scabrispora TaxID=159449 RepID=A0A1T3NIF6_9ACTN|nr:hypothetical protein [Embleya scabrispora]OPC76495.1 hypothetical protein B4N89_46565 [Embleya scabrispora]
MSVLPQLGHLADSGNRTLVLIDLENIIGANAQTGTALAKLDALPRHVERPGDLVAACVGSRIRPAVTDALRTRGVRVLFARSSSALERHSATAWPMQPWTR